MKPLTADPEPALPAGVLPHPAPGGEGDAVPQVHATLGKPILRPFVAGGLLESCDAKGKLAYQHIDDCYAVARAVASA